MVVDWIFWQRLTKLIYFAGQNPIIQCKKEQESESQIFMAYFGVDQRFLEEVG